MKDLLLSILKEFSPCSSYEIYDYIRSDFFYEKGNICLEDVSIHRISTYLTQIEKERPEIVKFRCKSGFPLRYGYTKFKYFLLDEIRYLRPKGYLKRCMYCGMPMFIEENHIFHFKYKCDQYQHQNMFKLIKFGSKRAIISANFVFGVIDDINQGKFRLPDTFSKTLYHEKEKKPSVYSELWMINHKAREIGIIEKDRLLPLKAEEYIAE
ncbi:hypothetical protein [Candidatus Harpocratesius sp.]